MLQPDPGGAAHLLGYFFRMGPATADGPLDLQEVRSWARTLTGFDEWPAWQEELFVRLSREYCTAQFAARDYDAPPPWAGAARMWGWVRAQQMEERAKRALADPVPKGRGKRG